LRGSSWLYGYLGNKAYSDLVLENFLFSAAGGFLFGAIAGYAIKKVMKTAAAVVGLFVTGVVYLSYKGWIDIKWMEIEKATRAALTSLEGQAVHELNNAASHFATHSSTVATSGFPIAAGLGFVPGLVIGFKRG
jgi:uncharacterized membrane protein (Fun14 family)